MSIIDEALKKTQRQLSQAGPIPDDTPMREVSQQGKSAMESASSQPRFNWSFLIFFALLSALLMVQVLHPFKHKVMKTAAVVAPAHATLSGTAPPLGVDLKGIMVSGDRRVALINQRTYMKGDQVKGYTVQSIGENSVILTRANQVYRLHVS